MPTQPLTPELRTLAPIVALRLTAILAGLAALIARAFLKNPRFLPIILPLHRRLTHAARRFAALMAGLAAGQLPRQRPSRPGGGRGPKPAIPTTKAWLIHTLRHEAVFYRGLLAALLAEPGVADLLAAAPSAQRLLNPIRRALHLPTVANPRPKPPPEPAVPLAPLEAEKAGVRGPNPKRATAAPPYRHPLYPTLTAFRPFPPRIRNFEPG